MQSEDKKTIQRMIETIMEAAEFLGEFLRENLEEIAEIIAEECSKGKPEPKERESYTERITGDSTQRFRRFELPDWYTTGFE